MASSAKEWVGLELVDKRSLMNNRKRVDPSTELWRTPAFRGHGCYRMISTRKEMVLLSRELAVYDMRNEMNPKVEIFGRKLRAKLGQNPLDCREKPSMFFLGVE